MTATCPQSDQSPSATEVATQPVFILGVWKRSGTNYVADLLRLHPSFQIAAPLWEDFLTARSPLLSPFVDSLCESWRWWLGERGEGTEEVRSELYRHLGKGLIEFLQSRLDDGRRLLCKTPFTENIGHFFTLFPDSRLVILVRDGRDVVESAKRSWPKKSYAFYAKQWAKGARHILEFMNGAGKDHMDRWILVRYEDLLSSRDEVRRLIEFVGIEENAFPWDRIEQMPVRGSSSLRSSTDELTWKPVEKDAGFQPVCRWDTWGRIRKLKFQLVAGRELRALGYAPERW